MKFSNIVMKPWICEDSELGGNTVSKTVYNTRGKKSYYIVPYSKKSLIIFLNELS